jgi:hypothetical protein
MHIIVAERFQEQASAIQAGTHESSPADPFLFRLEDLHADLQDLIVGFSSRVNLLGQQAREAFTPPPPPEVETPPPAEPDVPVPVESESPAPVEAAPEPKVSAPTEPAPVESTEPEVSILPIVPVEDVATDFDPAQVVIGKSPEQVVQAMGNIPDHEEL